MSADRYEIIDRDELISIKDLDGTTTEICGTDPGGGTYLDDVVIAAIRQQARDIELLRVELADMTEQRDAWRRRAEESEPHLTAKSPGVQGLAQLSRNAIERVSEMERELARERETNAALRRDIADPTPDMQEAALKRCGHFEIVSQLRSELAAPVAEIDRKDYALTAIIQIAERRQDCADILTIARTARLPDGGES